MRNKGKFRYRYREQTQPVFGFEESAQTRGGINDQREHEYEGQAGESIAILEQIHDAIEDAYQQSHGPDPRVIVLGAHEYTAVDAYLRHDSAGDEDIESYFGYDIITVPGRMIHVPQSNEQALIDYVKSGDGDA